MYKGALKTYKVSSAIGSRKYRIPSDLRSQAGYRLVSTMVGDHMGILGAEVIFAAPGPWTLSLRCLSRVRAVFFSIFEDFQSMLFCCSASYAGPGPTLQNGSPGSCAERPIFYFAKKARNCYAPEAWRAGGSGW